MIAFAPLRGVPIMTDHIYVFVYASDPISQAGIAAQLRGQPGIRLVEEADVDGAHVALVSTDAVDEQSLRVARAIQRNGCPRVVLVVSQLEEGDALLAVEAGVVGLVRRTTATTVEIAEAIRAAARGEGTVPADLLGRLLRQVHHIQHEVLGPRGLTFSGLNEREVEVLRLVAEGLDTKEIAGQLCYSERTIKNVIQDVTRRFGLRNRSHAVAYALRQGLI